MAAPVLAVSDTKQIFFLFSEADPEFSPLNEAFCLTREAGGVGLTSGRYAFLFSGRQGNVVAQIVFI